MLINKDNPKLNDVVSIRLVSGDEIVGRLLDSAGNNDVRLSRPIAAVMQPAGRDLGLAFAPFMATASDIADVTFPASAVLCRPVKTRDDIAKGYTQATSPIIQPETGLIVPK